MVFQVLANLPAPISGLVPNDQTAATNNRVLINAAITAANAAGGGTVYLPRGLYYVNGTGTPSDGAIQILSYVTLAGQGMGVTTIKLADSQSAEVTGIVRTPSGEVTTFWGCRDFTIDGNDTNNAQVVKGFYCGVSPSHRCTVSVSGTVGSVTTYNDGGTAVRSNGLVTNDVIFLTNGLVEGLNGNFTYTRLTNSTGTIVVASGTSSDLVGYTWYYDDPFASIADTNFIVENMEVTACQDYGFDPHERCSQFVFRNCYSHHNGTSSDGFTFDGNWDGLVENCYAYSNGRNGFNIITGSGRVKFVGCEAWLNGQYGFASQRGSTSNGSGTVQENTDITFDACNSYSNTQYGFRIVMNKKCKIVNCNPFINSRDGIRFEGSVGCEAVANQVHGNGQQTTNTYPEINVLQFALDIYNIQTASTATITYGSTYNIISSNVIDSDLAKKSNYSGLEADDASDFNWWINNQIITAGTTGGLSVPSGNTSSAILGATNYDNVWRLVDNADATKQLAFDPSGITTATTRTVTIPNANGTMAYITKAAEGAVTGTITWNGTPPSSTSTLRYWWQQVGQMVIIQYRLQYLVAGSTITTLDIDLEAGAPLPADVTGVVDGGWLETGSCNLFTSATGSSGASNSSRCVMFKNTASATGYRIGISGATSGSYLGATITISYLAATSLQ